MKLRWKQKILRTEIKDGTDKNVENCSIRVLQIGKLYVDYNDNEMTKWTDVPEVDFEGNKINREYEQN